MRKTRICILLLAAVLMLGLCSCGMSTEKKYNQAVADVKAGKYDEAIAAFEALNDYEDSGKYIMYARCLRAGDSGDYETAVKSLNSLGDFKEAGMYVKYYTALSYEAEQRYEEAGKVYDGILLFKDAQTRNAALPDKILEREYQKAEKLWENGQYFEAMAIYATIREYKDVNEIMTSHIGIVTEKYQPGNYVTLGTYPQTESGTDNTPIEWLVLESDGETALLISRYVLDSQPYNTVRRITWEQSTLRSWLNDEFYNRAFSDEEKQSILKSDVSADRNPSYSTNPGNATKDNVFLLSIVEANKYFASNEARMCAATDYAIQQGAWTSDVYAVDGRSPCWWWLRSPGMDSGLAACVDYGGSIVNKGSGVVHSYGAVRPCVRVRLF